MITLDITGNNDIYLDSGGNIAMSTGAQGVEAVCRNHAQTILGEMMHATDIGVPYFFGSASLVQIRASLRRRLLQVDGVTAIDRLDVLVDGDAIKYTADIRTIYGGLSISN